MQQVVHKLSPDESLLLARYCCSFYNVEELMREMMKKPYKNMTDSEKRKITKLRIFKQLTEPKHDDLRAMVPADLWHDTPSAKSMKRDEGSVIQQIKDNAAAKAKALNAEAAKARNANSAPNGRM